MEDQAVQQVPIASIVCRKQVRETFGVEELAGLAQSIKENGVLQALLAHREGSSVVLDDGERRLRAAMQAGLQCVPVVVDERELGIAEIIQLQLVANCQRADLSPMEKAKAIDQLLHETNWSAAQVSVKLGISPAQTSKLLSLLLLPPEVQAQVASGQLAASTAYEIAKVSDTKERSRLAAQAANGDLTRDKAAAQTRALGKCAKPRQRSGPHRDRIVVPLGDGRSLAVSGAGLNLDWLLKTIEHLLRRLRDASAGGLALPEVVKSLSGKQR